MKKKEDNTDYDSGISQKRGNGLYIGGGVAGGIIAVLAYIGGYAKDWRPEINSWLDNSKKEAYYIAVIEQDSNEKKRTNQLMEQMQDIVKGLRSDMETAKQDLIDARTLAKAERKDQSEKIEKLTKQIEYLTSVVNATTLALKDCQEGYSLKKK